MAHVIVSCAATSRDDGHGGANGARIRITIVNASRRSALADPPVLISITRPAPKAH